MACIWAFRKAPFLSPLLYSIALYLVFLSLCIYLIAFMFYCYVYTGLATMCRRDSYYVRLLQAWCVRIPLVCEGFLASVCLAKAGHSLFYASYYLTI